MSITYHAREVGTVTILDIVGRIDVGVALLAYGLPGQTPLRTVVRELCDRGRKFVVFNLRDVSYVDSSGIGELVACATTLRNAGGDLNLVNPNWIVQKLLHITRLDPLVFDVLPDEATALCAFERRDAASSAAPM